jgi:hypothetical protein
MPYQSRRRNYVSRRERLLKVLRYIRVVLFFAVLFFVVFAATKWDTIVFYWKTYFVY